jgi:hypothetical protein
MSVYEPDITEPYLTIGLTVPNQVIRPTAIIVARGVFQQWVRNIEKYTTLRVFPIADKTAARKFCACARDGNANDYDVVLIKHEHTPVDDSAMEVHGDKKFVDLCEFINLGTIPLMWSRAVYDDVDAIGDATQLRAISSVYVTGAIDFACKVPVASTKWIVHETSLRRLVCDLPAINHVYRVPASTQCGLIWSTCGHDPRDIARSRGLYAVTWLRCRITNRESSRAISLIRDAATDCDELLRMIENDALESAASMLHITTQSPSAMFASILGSQREEYETAQARLELLTHDEESTHHMIAHHRALVVMASREIGLLPKFDIDVLESDDENACEELRRALGAFIARLDRSFARISENIADQTCAVCYMPLAGMTVAIMRCCGFVACAECCLRGSAFRREHDHLTGSGTCIQCRRVISLSSDIIFIGKDVDAHKLIADTVATGHSIAQGAVEPHPSAAGTSSSAHNIKSKVEYIVALACGCKSDDVPVNSATLTVSRETREVKGLMDGDAPPDAITDIRGIYTRTLGPRGVAIVIFSQFDESVDAILHALNEASVPCARMLGSAQEYNQIVGDFEAGKYRAIIINSRAIFAGIDMPWVTDIVVVGNATDDHLGQIVGRAQRLGRTCALRVHMLEYVDAGGSKA